MSGRDRLASVNDAIEGILYAFRTQANLRIHFLIAGMTLILAGVLGLSRTDFLVVTIVIGMVIAAELVNTAVEGCIDLIAEHYHPLARTAKDAAAGAVLVASTVAVIAGFLVFYPHLTGPTLTAAILVRRAPAYVSLIAVVLVVIIVVAAKARLGKGTFLSGGMPSGHAAVAFAIFTAVALSTTNPLIIILALLLAVMVGQSRLVYRIHTLREVVAGAVLGGLVTLLLFRLFA